MTCKSDFFSQKYFLYLVPPNKANTKPGVGGGKTQALGTNKHNLVDANASVSTLGGESHVSRSLSQPQLAPAMESLSDSSFLNELDVTPPVPEVEFEGRHRAASFGATSSA